MNYKETIDLLLKEFPDFLVTWKEHLDYWEGDKRSIGLDITAFSDYIAEKLENQEKYDFKKVFNFIEKLLTDGNKVVQTAATTMFLENLINFSSNGRFESKDFVRYLGPRSVKYCKAWDKFTGSKTEGIE